MVLIAAQTFMAHGTAAFWPCHAYAKSKQNLFEVCKVDFLIFVN